MASKESIITLPNPILRQRSRRVGLISDEIRGIVKDMKDATIDWEKSRKHEVGVALAAVQIAQNLRIIVIRNDFDNKEDETFGVFINPEITKYEGERVEDYEGCLSVKDIYGKVLRFEKVRIKAMNEEGQDIRFKAEGFHARIFQHEIDHTNGIMFIDHIKDAPEAFFTLNKEGKLDPIDYDKEVKNSTVLW